MTARACAFALVLLFGSVARAQDSATTLKPVVVTVTRGSGRTILASPFAISMMRPDSARPGQLHSALDESIALIPGVISVNRSNPSQDPRVSIRGFGSRSAFGVRGIRVLRDGMPITLPDGQTPLDYLSLESVGNVEVLRGSASGLYGNAGGGVIDLHSADPSPARISMQAKQWIGSDALSRSVLAGSGTLGSMTYLGDVSYSSSDGFRDHSSQRATTGFARITTSVLATDLSFSAMGLVNPLAENPGPLTLDEMTAGRRAADGSSLRRDAKKSVNQIQLGFTGARRFRAVEASLSAYGGARSLDNPLTFAVVEVGRHTWGASGALRGRGGLFGADNSFIFGFDLQKQNDLRRNFAVCNDTVPVTTPTASCPIPGNERGVVSLDQRELVSSAGIYASDAIPLGTRVSLTFGMRGDRVRFDVKDRLITESNPDDSGVRSLASVSPVAGIVGRIASTHALYANMSTAFETPTATELGNHEDGSAGINPDLDPQRSITVEAGIKGWFGGLLRYDASVFRTGVRDELIPFEIPASNGRRYFRNAGRTVRKGMEAGADLTVRPFTLMAAYTFSHFRFDDYSVAGTDFSGNVIPGIPGNRLQAAARIDGRNLFVVLENETSGKAWLDDANTARASSYSVTGARAGWSFKTVPGISVTTGVRNIFDRVYASSLVVNAARGKYFEPAPGRTFFVGVSIQVESGER